MFKKFKDKLAEEMKQSPARLQASMQQLAQAVVSPALSNSSIQDLSASNDNFSLTEGGDETPKNYPAQHGFQNVDLTSLASNSLERQPSVSSITSVDAASLFPIYESPGNMYHLQSDMEQSASEADENISPQLDRVSKDQLYAAYRKVQTKYHKCRGRYTDLANHYREMERVKGKLESLLVETQDKALRRIADLKEQCQLEQQAKAHLEEALRNDIEEKDHVIDTLNTKVRLLQAGGPVPTAFSVSSLDESHQNQTIDQLIDVSTEMTSSSSQAPEREILSLANENTQLKLKLEKLESLIAKYKESLKRNKEKILEISQEKSIIERDFEISRNSSYERFAQLEDDLNVARNESLNLSNQVTAMRKREEESVISLAENKLTIHRELEVKEEQIKELRRELKMSEGRLTLQRELEVKDEQIKELRKELKSARETCVSLEESVEHYKSELECLRTSSDQTTDAEKADLVRDLSKGKTEALKLMQKEMQRRVMELEKTMGVKCQEEEAKNRELIDKLERREQELRSFERETIELRKEAENYRDKCEALRNEMSMIKDKQYRNEIGDRNVDAKRSEAENKKKQHEAKTNHDENEAQQPESEGKQLEDKIMDIKTENKWLNEVAQEPREAQEICHQVDTGKSKRNIQEKSAKYSKQTDDTEMGDHYRIKCENLSYELSCLKLECNALKAECESLGKISRETKEAAASLENSIAGKDVMIQQLNSKVELYAVAIQKARERLVTQRSEINSLRGNSERDNELTKFQEDSEKKTIEILGIMSELDSTESMSNELREKIRGDTEKIDLLRKEKICLISNVLEYKRAIAELKRSCGDVRTRIEEYDQSRIEEFARIRQIVAANFEKYSSVQALRSEKEMRQLVHLKQKVENELKERNEEISVMREKVYRWDETNRRNNKLIAEIDSLNFKIFDLEKLKIELEDAKVNLENLKSENLELKMSGEESAKLRAESEHREKIIEENSTKLRDSDSAEENLSTSNEEFLELNSRMKFEHKEGEKNVDDKRANLASELSKSKNQYEEERECEEERRSFAELSEIEKAERENHDKLIADYAEKLEYFEVECAKRDMGLEKLRVTMEKREQMLEDMIEKSKNFELEILKLSEEKLRLELELENRKKLVNDCNEKLKNFEIQNSELSSEKSKLTLELENREKLMENSNVTLKNLEFEFSKLSEEKLRLSTDMETREKVLASSAEKLRSFEAEFSSLSAEKSKLAAELENREKSLEDISGKLRNLENEFSKLSQEHSVKVTESENRERILRETVDKLRNIEVEFAKVSEERSKLVSKLEDREKQLEDSSKKLKNLEYDFSRLSEEKSEISIELESLRTASTEFEGSTVALEKTINSKNASLKKLKALKEQQELTIQDSENKIMELETKLLELEAKSYELEAERSKNMELASKISELEITEELLRKSIREFEEKSSKIMEEKENLGKINEDLRKEISENSLLREEFEKLKIRYKESKELCNELEKTNGDLKNLKEDMEKKLEELEKMCAKRMEEIVNFKSEITRRDEELKRLGENSGQRLEDLEELRKKLEEDFRNRADKLDDEYMEKCRDREMEAKHLKDELKLNLEAKELELRAKIAEESQEDHLRQLVQQLQNQLQDKESQLLSSQTKGSQIQILNEELNSRTDKLKEEMETREAEQSIRLKQLVKEFQAQLHDKDEELQAALDKRFESQQNYESDLVQQYREQLKDFQVELTAKSEYIESLVIEKKEEIAMKNKEMEKLIETIEKIKQEHMNELREIEQKWRATMKQKSDQLEAKYEEDVSELTREWQHERRNDVNADVSPEELENTSRIAMAAVQSNTGSLHSLQQTLVSQRRELAELRKLVKLRQDTLEDSTEIEYLRNILYEYMMGRETVVLARVIAAVVKFDQEQTMKILKKEEDKLTLLGSLGLS